MKLFTLKNKRHMPKWIAYLAACLVRAIAWTYRVTVDESRESLERLAGDPTVDVVWHNRLLFYTSLVPRRLLNRCSVLISNSRDGEYVATFAQFFGINIVRGSSSKGGARALIDLIHVAQEGQNPVLTVDGPRGPRYTVHPGVVAISRKANIPIMPFSLNARHKWELKSWDRLQIPVPFSKVTFVVGKPFYIPEELTVEEACAYVRDKLMELTED